MSGSRATWVPSGVAPEETVYAAPMGELDVVAEHRAEGRMFGVDGVQSFVREEGEGPAVLCLHGVPTSSFLYRKVLRELAGRGVHAIAFDFPGLGLAERPEDFDYSWTGLGRFTISAVDALGLDRFHLVVHDIGGPVGFELAAARSERIESLTILNTLVDVADFKKPWPMRPFERSVVGEVWLKAMTRPGLRLMMRLVGVADMTAVSKAEFAAYLDLLRKDDGGRAFLKIMRSFETTPAKQEMYRSTLREAPYPAQVIWGDRDPALTVDTFGEAARRAVGVGTIHQLPAKHFLQEDQAEPLAELIASFVSN